MDWLRLALGAVGIVSALLAYLRERRLLDDAGQAEVAAALKVQVDEMERAQRTRMAARGAARTNPAGSLPNDGFRRD